MFKQPLNTNTPAASRGIALIVALLLLVMLTILGVTSMSGVVMQERMAGNVNLQSLAFEAASAGVPQSVQFADPTNWPPSAMSGGAPLPCLRGEGEWVRPIGPTAGGLPVFNPLEVPNLPDGITVGFQQWIGCFEPEDSPEEWDEFDLVSLQLLVLNRGLVLRDGEELARREVEVRVNQRSDADCLMTIGPLGCVPGEPCNQVGMGDSKQGIVDGGPGGCPIRVANAADAAAMRADLIGKGNNSRLGNYQPNPPGIHAGPLPGVWSDPENLARAVNAVKIGIRAWRLWEDSGLGGGSPPPGMDCNALPPGIPSCDQWVTANPFASCAGTLNTTMPGSPPSDPNGLFYIADNLAAGGNDVVQGMVFVEGQMEFNGSATYTGDLIILGGSLNVNGFGNAGNRGSLQLHNLLDRETTQSSQVAYNPEDAYFGSSQVFNINGMGKASITPDNCLALRGRWQNVNSCIDSLKLMGSDFSGYQDLLNDEFDPPPNLQAPDFGDDPDAVTFAVPRCGQFANQRNVIASWREYIDRERWN